MVEFKNKLSAIELMILIKFKVKCLDHSRNNGSLSKINRINELIEYLEDMRHAIENNNTEIDYFNNK